MRGVAFYSNINNLFCDNFKKHQPAIILPLSKFLKYKFQQQYFPLLPHLSQITAKLQQTMDCSVPASPRAHKLSASK